MVLKKQTVWLLTMLSLIVVLSVYYITSSPTTNTPTAQSSKTKDQATASSDVKDGLTTSDATSDDALSEYRLAKDDEDRKTAQQYEATMASDDSTAAEVSKAQDGLESLQTMSQTESKLEDEIMAKGYKDAVVSTSGSTVSVYVKAGSLSNKQTNEIMRMVNSELGDVQVTVTREPVK
ncbi:stage III sporulation protein AH [Pullulanibacillus pueri]|uniref:Stage III sporulation protein AH n=1 Tax=Pullulanibacillus pueri TaxID=1437324 RepID=A0A8J2ZV72_9BACL|nr:SpoIIIAH-like family protein [Pullulanibacillus pueri]MBM7681591.1 stage III sporulation protein AH [Pullulanibacillus pueri]GGH79546.1 stage III sporulation protein AH [Pullulanibacillus pueri]